MELNGAIGAVTGHGHWGAVCKGDDGQKCAGEGDPIRLAVLLHHAGVQGAVMTIAIAHPVAAISLHVGSTGP